MVNISNSQGSSLIEAQQRMANNLRIFLTENDLSSDLEEREEDIEGHSSNIVKLASGIYQKASAILSGTLSDREIQNGALSLAVGYCLDGLEMLSDRARVAGICNKTPIEVLSDDSDEVYQKLDALITSIRKPKNQAEIEDCARQGIPHEKIVKLNAWVNTALLGGHFDVLARLVAYDETKAQYNAMVNPYGLIRLMHCMDGSMRQPEEITRELRINYDFALRENADFQKKLATNRLSLETIKEVASQESAVLKAVGYNLMTIHNKFVD